MPAIMETNKESRKYKIAIQKYKPFSEKQFEVLEMSCLKGLNAIYVFFAFFNNYKIYYSTFFRYVYNNS